MATLNAGCGMDEWGDVRIDSRSAYRGRRYLRPPTIYGDVRFLPFRDRCFAEVRCYHVLEEICEWKNALVEVARVASSCVDLKFPVGDGFIRPLLLNLLQLRFEGVASAYRCRTHASHFWIINPRVIEDRLRAWGFNVFVRRLSRSIFDIKGISWGRKGRLFSYLGKFARIACEWEVVGLRR